MYHQHFGFVQEPFAASPDPRLFYPSGQHEEAAALIKYSIAQGRGFAALIAPPGLGKTSVILQVIEELRQTAEVVFLVHPLLDGAALLESVLTGLGVDPSADATRRMDQLASRLADLHRRNRSCVVILDEAQNLTPQALESVRMLSNFEIPGRKLIEFVLVGQSSLSQLLMKPECEQIRQRIGIIARLEPLDAQGVSELIAHRVKAAGCRRNPFTREAVEAIAAASGGVPRNVVNLCFNALTIGFVEEVDRITANLVSDAVQDLSLAAAPQPAASAPAQPAISPWLAPHTVRVPLARAALVLAVLAAASYGIGVWAGVTL